MFYYFYFLNLDQDMIWTNQRAKDEVWCDIYSIESKMNHDKNFIPNYYEVMYMF